MTLPPTDGRELRDGSNTDRNGDELVGAILDIIDRDNSRYKVAVSVAAYIREYARTERLDEVMIIPNPAYINTKGLRVEPLQDYKARRYSELTAPPTNSSKNSNSSTTQEDN